MTLAREKFKEKRERKKERKDVKEVKRERFSRQSGTLIFHKLFSGFHSRKTTSRHEDSPLVRPGQARVVMVFAMIVTLFRSGGQIRRSGCRRKQVEFSRALFLPPDTGGGMSRKKENFPPLFCLWQRKSEFPCLSEYEKSDDLDRRKFWVTRRRRRSRRNLKCFKALGFPLWTHVSACMCASQRDALSSQQRICP